MESLIQFGRSVANAESDDDLVSQPLVGDFHLGAVEFMSGILQDFAGDVYAEEAPRILLKLALPVLQLPPEPFPVSHQDQKPAIPRAAFLQIHQVKHSMIDQAEIPKMAQNK